MGIHRFCHYELRTTELDAARAFYTAVLGPGLFGSDVTLSPLPERLRVLGVPAHWLGHVGVEDVEATLARMVAQGAQQLGPIQRAADGSVCAVLRDPSEAVLALRTQAPAQAPSPVAWQLLHTQDEARAFAWYASALGWSAGERLDLGPEVGCFQEFAWDASGHGAGAIANSARLRHVHPHWLFYFAVPELEAALARVRAHGGIVLHSLRTPGGDLVAPCDDPQGAGFALYQRSA